MNDLKFDYVLMIFACFVISCGIKSKPTYSDKPAKIMTDKLMMQSDRIVRLSKIEVFPEYLDEYRKFAMEVGAESLRTEPGVITMYAMAGKENPCVITILETYSSQEAYKSHIASAHFQKYKQGTLHMVKSLELCDQTPLNEKANLINLINE